MNCSVSAPSHPDIVQAQNAKLIFGAVGNGTADDTTPLNNTIATKQSVFIPEGVYKITAPLSATTLGQNIEADAVGNAQGYGTTIIQSTSGANAFEFINSTDTIVPEGGGPRWLDLVNVAFQQPNSNTGKGIVIGQESGGVTTYGGAYNNIQDVQVYGFHTGFDLVTGLTRLINTNAIGDSGTRGTYGYYFHGSQINSNIMIGAAGGNCETGLYFNPSSGGGNVFFLGDFGANGTHVKADAGQFVSIGGNFEDYDGNGGIGQTGHAFDLSCVATLIDPFMSNVSGSTTNSRIKLSSGATVAFIGNTAENWFELGGSARLASMSPLLRADAHFTTTGEAWHQQPFPALADNSIDAASVTGGTLIVGLEYVITTYVSGDDFTNVGAASNASGVRFVATGTTPTTWSNGSTVGNLYLRGVIEHQIALYSGTAADDLWIFQYDNSTFAMNRVSLLPTSLLARANSWSADQTITGTRRLILPAGAAGGGISAATGGLQMNASTVNWLWRTSQVEGNDLALYYGNTLRMLINEAGTFGWAGDIESTTNGKGVVVQSPNGTRYRITVSNGGVVTATSL